MERLLTTPPSEDSPPRRLRDVAALRRFDIWLPPLIAATVVQRWFAPGLHIASGDVPPFGNPSLADTLTDLWGYHLSGAGSPSYEIARIVDVAIGHGASMLGLSPATGQRVLYTVLAAAVAAAATFMVAPLTDRRWVRVGAGVTAVVNAYWMLLIPNPIFLWAIGTGALLGGFVLRAIRGRPPSVWVVTLGSLSIVPLAVNPPLVFTMALWVGVLVALGWVIDGRAGLARAGRLVIRSLPGALAVNAFWIVPAAVVFTSSSTVVAAERSVEAWAWSHAQNSILNVASLSAHWGWAFPQMYFPFVPRLDMWAFSWMKFGLPLLAVAAPIVTRGRARRLSMALVGISGVLIFLAKGLHSPLAGVNGWLYGHVPLLWLLREPMSKLGWALLLVYLLAGAITADHVLERWARSPDRWTAAAATAVAVAILATWAFAHPLLTGEAVPDARSEFPSSHVEVPGTWADTATAVDSADDGGAVLMLPIPSFYQMDHTWGYYGTDEYARRQFTRRTVHVSTGGYFADPPAFRNGVGLIETSLVSDRLDTAERLLESLGISTVVIRRDYEPGTSQRRVADPAALERGLASSSRWRLLTSTAVASVWTSEVFRPRLSIVDDIVESDTSAEELTAEALAAAPVGSALVPTGSVPSGSASVSWTHDSSTTELALSRRSRLDVSMTLIAPVSWLLRVTPDGVTVEPADRLLLDGSALLWGPIDVPLDVAARIAEVGGRFVTLDPSARAVAEPGSVVDFYAPVASSSLDTFDPSAGVDCNAYDARTPEEAGISVLSASDGITLRSSAHSACVRYPLPNAGSRTLVTVSATRVSGSPPRMCVFDTGSSECVATDRLTNSTGELQVSVPSAPGLVLYLYADEPAPGGADRTEVDYGHPRVEGLGVAGSVRLPELPSTLVTPELSAGTHRLVTAQSPDTSYRGLEDVSGIEDCHRYDERTPTEAGLAVTAPTADSIELTASAHSGCVWTPLGAPRTGALQIDFDYRNDSGSPARVCLWMVGPDRCADLPALESGEGWRHFSAIARPDPSARDLDLYFYADSPPPQVATTTRVRYRALHVSPASPWVAVATMARHRVDVPEPTISLATPDRLVALMPQDLPDDPLLVLLDDAYDQRWTLDGVPGVSHVRVDGWANGWVVPSGSDLAGTTVTVRFRPARWARLAQWLSAAAVAVALAGALVPGSTSTRKERRA